MGGDHAGRGLPVATIVGLALIAAAGILMIAATFLPWVVQPASYIEAGAAHPLRGGNQEQTYSGWDLEQRCGEPNGFGNCSVPTESYVARESIFTGTWTLIVGAAFVLTAVLLTVALVMRWRVARALYAVSFLVAIFAVAVALWLWHTASNLPTRAFVQDAGVDRPLADPVRYGVVVVMVAAGVGLVGTALAYVGRRKIT